MASLAEVLAARSLAKQQIASISQCADAPAHNFTAVNGKPLNNKQGLAVQYTIDRKSFCLIGSAGTGKTTTVATMASYMLQQDIVSRMPDGCTSKRLAGLPAMAFVAFTNRAVRRLKQCLPVEFRKNSMTIHKLLEYQKQKIETINEDGLPEFKTTFLPRLTHENPDNHVQIIVFEESSMISVDLHQQVIDAFPKATCIYLGDLNQIKPVYGNSILGFKLTHLPIVELTEVYRQANGSPIIDLAYLILRGTKIAEAELKALTDRDSPYGKVSFTKINKKVEGDKLLPVVARSLISRITSGDIDLDNCQILMPFNKSFGTTEMNNHIAQALGQEREAEVFEIHASFAFKYFAIGDRVIHNKNDYFISDIRPNAFYAGKKAHLLRSGKTLTRWGTSAVQCQQTDNTLASLADMNSLGKSILAEEIDMSNEGEEKKRQASHIVVLTPISFDGDEVEDSSDNTVELKASGDIAALEFSYAISIHKAQGSEWPHVILATHHSNNSMLCRELVYTAVTRASQHIEIISEFETFAKAPLSHSIKGNNLQDKIAYFAGKIKNEHSRGFDPINNKRIKEI